MDEKVQINQDQEVFDVNSLPQWYTRFAAYTIDISILILISIPLGVILSIVFAPVSNEGTVGKTFLTNLLSTVIALFTSIYFAYFHSKEGATWGMKYLGIKINQPSGELLSFQNAYLRSILIMAAPNALAMIPWVGQILGPLLALALFISILIDNKKQGIHDKLFNAIYSKTDEKTSRAKWVIGCSCGCLIPLMIGIIGVIAAGLASMSVLSNPELLKSKLMNETTPQTNLKPQEMKKEMPETSTFQPKVNNDYNQKMDLNQSTTTEQPKTSSGTKANPFEGLKTPEEIYNACLSLNTNPKVDIKDYCSCLVRELNTATSGDDLINKCKSYIKLVN